MEIEQLKIIADGMGYRTKVTPSRCAIATNPYEHCPNLIRWVKYNPLQDNNQCMEIMEKIIHEGIYHIRGGANPDDVHIRDKDYTLIAKGKTINEAVCNAALVHFNEN